MPFEFVLPDLGEGITEGEVRKWLVREGDAVDEHQVVLEVETDKAIVEVPSPRTGRIVTLLKKEGEIAKVGEALMVIAEEGEAPPERPASRSVSVVGVLPEAPEEEILATPAVRALARERGVSLSGIRGSGPGGSITSEDVERRAGEAKKSEDQYGPVERLPIRGLRKTIARNLLASQRMTAFVTGMDEADVTELAELRKSEMKALLDRGVHLTFIPFFIKAVQHALAEHPLLNASVDEETEEVVVKKYCNFGIAVDTPEGLMVPVIRNADRKTIIELSEEIMRLSDRARNRRITLEELKGSTFTITNYGHFGGTFATPIINYPDVAILGTGRIAEKPWVREGRIVIRKILPLSLTFDHRVTDGVDAARFLTKVIAYLEDPARLFIESA
jgi:pyruvate dehydrogenase E2 component (dihydrolipoamide acetyltransferase)